MSRPLRILASLLLVACLAFGAELTGKWYMAADAPDGKVHKFELVIRNEDGKLSGTAGSAEEGTIQLQDVKIEGESLSFKLNHPEGGLITFKLQLKGDSLQGTLTTGDGAGGTVTGKR